MPAFTMTICHLVDVQLFAIEFSFKVESWLIDWLIHWVQVGFIVRRHHLDLPTHHVIPLLVLYRPQDTLRSSQRTTRRSSPDTDGYDR
jgi:hypothetical protein